MLLYRAIFIQALCTTIYILLLSKMSSAKSAAGIQSAAPVPTVDLEKLCINFTLGNAEKREFTSPNYPEEYPPKIKCTKQITADFGHVVHLDFREQFKMEESPTCEYDKLIVRDGPYGYSPVIDVLCGKEFPNRIASSDRYLWLQFISDESIEMKGFKAVYQFSPVTGVQKKGPTEECAFTRTGHAGVIQKEEIEEQTLKYAEETQSPIDCIWIITADHPQKVIYLNFIEFALKFPNDCEKNFVDIYESSRIDTEKTVQFCGTTAEPKKVESHIVHIRLFMHFSAYNMTKFKVHYTVLRNIKKPETCNALEFDCGDNTCIDKSLVCDKQPDCKYRYDEDQATCQQASVAGMVLTSEHMIIILVVFFALVVAMCASISISCYNKIQDRKIREREYKERRSKEASVDATMDRAIRGHSSPERGPEPSLVSQKSQHLPRTHYPDDGDDESSDGCYVPEVDLSAFEKYPNGGGTIPRGPDGRSVSRGGIQSQYPFISHSTDSIESETIIPPAPPPVPSHLKDRREPISTPQPPLSYRFIGGKAIPDIDRPKTPPTDARFKPVTKPEMDRPTPSSTLQRNRWPPEAKMLGTMTTPTKSPIEPKGLAEPRTTRGPLEAGVPRSIFTRNPGDYGLPRFGVARPSAEISKGPMAKATDKVLPLSIYKPPESYGNTPYRPATYRDFKNKQDERLAVPHQFRAQAKIETSDRDSSRADSVDSIQSAPDVVAQR